MAFQELLTFPFILKLDYIFKQGIKIEVGVRDTLQTKQTQSIFRVMTSPIDMITIDDLMTCQLLVWSAKYISTDPNYHVFVFICLSAYVETFLWGTVFSKLGIGSAPGGVVKREKRNLEVEVNQGRRWARGSRFTEEICLLRKQVY